MKRLLFALVITALAVCGIICHKPPQEPEPTIIPETTCTTISTAPTENEETEPFSQPVTEPATTTEPWVLRPEQDATDCEQPVEEKRMRNVQIEGRKQICSLISIRKSGITRKHYSSA